MGENTNNNQSSAASELYHVLIVDDDIAYRALLERYLKSNSECPFRVTGVESAAAATEAFRSTKFDCLVLDYILPDSTGTEYLLALREEFGIDLPPAVILTAAGGEEAATQAIRVNAADFISKRDVSQKSISRAVQNATEKFRLKAAVAERTEELKVAYKKLQHNSEEIKHFYHTISHEVKTPLTAIREFTSLIIDEIAGPINDKQRELLNYTMESCEQISSHFNDLIDLTRLETGKLALSKAWVSPDKLISRCVLGVEGVAKEKDIAIENKVVEELPLFHVDVNRVVQVLSNLLNNAIKYTGDGGKVIVSAAVSSEKNELSIIVQDSGCGISDEDKERIFDRLYQINPRSEGRSDGLGLGLSIAREIVLLHKGELVVESVVGVGSTFELRLPIESVEQNLETHADDSKAA